MKTTEPILMRHYCPKSPYKDDIRSIIQDIVNREAEMIIPEKEMELPPYEKQESGVYVEEGLFFTRFFKRLSI